MGHVVLFDVSGSMRLEWQTEANRRMMERCLLANGDVIRDEEGVVARAITAHNVVGGPDDPSRYWPQQGEQARVAVGSREGVAREITNRIEPTNENTDLHSAWNAGRTEAGRYLGATPSIVWMITDNWQDTGGDGQEEMDAFYASLQADSVVAAVYLVPLIRNPDGENENLVLYAILVTSRNTREWASHSLKMRLDKMLEAFRKEEGLVDYALRRIPCKFTIDDSPKIEKGSMGFENTSNMPIEFEVDGKTLVFENLRVGMPVEGKLSFKMRSYLEEWSLQGAPLKPALFRFSPPRHGVLKKPPGCEKQITPPVIDSKPGEVTESTYEIRFFGSDALFTPAMGRRPLRVFFPGAEDVVEGKMSLVISVDVSRNIRIDDTALEVLDGKIHLIGGIKRFIRGGGDSTDVKRIVDLPPAAYDLEFHVPTTVKVLGIPAGLLVLLLIGLGAGAVLAFGLLPKKANISVDEEPHEEVAVRAFGGMHRIKRDGATLGALSARFFGGTAFKIPAGARFDEGAGRTRLIGREPAAFTILVKNMEYEIRITPIVRG
ncbi:MAG: hypothetical protein ABIK65_14760 [Candidatus Eisenbacteria bacterium]